MNQLSDINLIEGLIKQNPKAQQTFLINTPLIPYRVSGFCLRFYLKRNNFLHKSFVCIVFFVYLQSLLI